MYQDVLKSIDDAVESRCACGCGQPLDPNGGSMWFRNRLCQKRYMERQATNPAEIYRGDDAAEVYEGADHLQIPLNEPGSSRRHWLVDRYLNAPPSAHAPARWDETHVVTDEQMRTALTPTELRIGGVDLSGHIRSATLEGSADVLAEERLRDDWARFMATLPSATLTVSFDDTEVTHYGDVGWREHLSGLRPSTVQQWIQANPTVGGRIDSDSVADWVEEQGFQLDDWQRSMLDAAYSQPQPRLYGPRRQPVQIGEYEIPVRYAQGVRLNRVIVVRGGWLRAHLHREGADLAEVIAEYDFPQQRYRFMHQDRLVVEVTAEMLEPSGATLRDVPPPPPSPEEVFDDVLRRMRMIDDILLRGNAYIPVPAEHFRTRRWDRRPKQARLDPKISLRHKAYRSRLLARRRRNR